MQSSRAAEVPEELFQRIVWHGCYNLLSERSVLDRAMKRSFSAYGTVCKYWANLARRSLFPYLRLTSSDDVDRFCAILDAPNIPSISRIHELVQGVCAVVSEEGMLWHHRVYIDVMPKLSKELPSPPSLSVEIHHSSRYVWRTLDPALPRPLPGSMIPLTTLLMCNVWFPNGRVLARLLCSLPSLERLVVVRARFDVQPAPEHFFTPPFGLNLCVTQCDDLLLSLAIFPRVLDSVPPQDPPSRPHRTPRCFLDPADFASLRDLLDTFTLGSSTEIFATREPSNLAIDAQCMKHVAFAFAKEIAGETDRYTWMYPKIRVDFDPIQANLPVLPTANAAQAEPTRLRVRRICIYVDDSPCRCSDALAHCPESLWVHFSDVALRFPHLQHVEVIKSSRRSEWSENLNLRNRAFQLLIEAGKFKFRYLDSSPEPVPGRLESKMPETRCARCTQSGYLLNVFLHRVIPLVLEQVGTARLFRTSDLPGLQHILDEVPAYRYHWQLWNDRHTRVRVAMDFVRRWQSGFASTAIRGLKILVAHMTKILESKGMASDEIPAAVADIIKEQLGWFRCSCCDKRERVFWYWYDENEESMTPKPYPFETPLVLYTLTHHVDTVGRQVFFKRMSDPHCQWKPPLGALMLSVLAAEHALRAFSAGVFVEPAPFLAADAEDGYPVEVGVCRVDVTQVTRMEDIIKERNLTREHWKDFFRSALLMQDILDVRLGRDNECKPPSIPSIKLGVPWDGINIPVAEW